jgi:hypothetical protein
MGFFSFLKYTFIIFAAHLATSCGAPVENRCYIPIELSRGCYTLLVYSEEQAS